MKIVIGCDPNAQEAKEKIIKYIEKNGYGRSNRFQEVKIRFMQM